MISFREQGAAYSCDEWLRPLCWNRRSLFLRVLNIKSPSLALYLDVCTFYHIATLYLSVLLSWCCNIKLNFWKGMTEPRIESFSFLEYFMILYWFLSSVHHSLLINHKIFDIYLTTKAFRANAPSSVAFHFRLELFKITRSPKLRK